MRPFNAQTKPTRRFNSNNNNGKKYRKQIPFFFIEAIHQINILDSHYMQQVEHTISENQQYEVVKILNRRARFVGATKNEDFEYLIKWQHIAMQEQDNITWEKYENLNECEEVLNDFLDLIKKNKKKQD